MTQIELVAFSAISGFGIGSMFALLIVLAHIRTLNRRLAKLEMLRWMSQTPQGVATQRATATAAQLQTQQILSTNQLQAMAQAQQNLAAKIAASTLNKNPKPTP